MKYSEPERSAVEAAQAAENRLAVDRSDAIFRVMKQLLLPLLAILVYGRRCMPRTLRHSLRRKSIPLKPSCAACPDRAFPALPV